MTRKIAYGVARANLGKILDQVSEGRDRINVTRSGKQDVVLMRADELAGLTETAHLLASPKNSERLWSRYAERRRRESCRGLLDDE